MILNDIDFQLEGLTIVTDTLEMNSAWLLRNFESPNSLVVSFREPFNGIDLSGKLFTAQNGKFASINLENLAAQIKSKNPDRLILEHPDILVSSGLTSPATLLDWIDHVSAKQTIISLCVHKGLLEKYPVSKAAAKFVISLLHDADQQIKVEPLVTGYSTEYNGTFELRRAKNSTTSTYLFQFEKDAVNVHPR